MRLICVVGIPTPSASRTIGSFASTASIENVRVPWGTQENKNMAAQFIRIIAGLLTLVNSLAEGDAHD
jgi:hypothetical protein